MEMIWLRGERLADLRMVLHPSVEFFASRK
jgi:hypothetical protein